VAVTTPVASLTSGGVAFLACSSALNGMKLIGEGRSASGMDVRRRMNAADPERSQ